MIKTEFVKVDILNSGRGEILDIAGVVLSDIINTHSYTRIGRVVSVCTVSLNRYLVTWDIPDDYDKHI